MPILRFSADEHSDIPFLKKFSDQQLFEIYKDAHSNEWPKLLGPAPAGFYGLPNDRPDGRKGRKIKKAKRDYTRPICRLTHSLLGYEKFEALRYMNMSIENRLIHDFIDVSHGSKIEDIEELSAHLAKNLDW